MPGGGLDGDTEGDLYESYLDSALAGGAEEPALFLARHPGASIEERARIEALHRLALGAPPRTAVRTPGRAAEPGLPWEKLGEFRLLRRVGAGGMGMVFEAEQASLGRNVALKVLRHDLHGSPEALERFRREARTSARLRHPNIVPVHAAGDQDGTRWLAMDLAPGRGLDELLAEAARRGEPVAPARAARWGARLARALEYAHSHGVIHRDVKPSNVRIAPDDQPLLLDFGIARDAETAATLTSAFVGSPHYAAPEQITGRKADGRADVYGLGALLYECLSGGPPFAAETVDVVLHRALTEDPAPLRRLRPGVPRDLDAIVLRALEKEPSRRYAGAKEMAEDLEALLEFRPVRARTAGPWKRVRAWARARPALASAAGTGVAALFALAAWGVAADRHAREQVRLQAAEEIAAARGDLDTYRRGRTEAERAEKTLVNLRDMEISQFLNAEQDASIEHAEDEVYALRRRREASFHSALERLRRAEQISPEVAGADTVRASLYLERWRDAEAAQDAPAAELYRNLARGLDPTGAVTEGALGKGRASFRSDPPGAEVHLYRYVEQSDVVPGGERRYVPVPVNGPAGPEPGSFALRVLRGAGGLAPGDLVTSVAGRPVRDAMLVSRGAGTVERLDRLASIDGVPVRDEWDAAPPAGSFVPDDGAAKPERTYTFVRGGNEVVVRGASLAALGIEVASPRTLAEAGDVPATVFSAGRPRDMVLPRGLRVLATAAPVPFADSTRIGRTPIEGLSLERAAYLAVFRMAGREDQRCHFRVDPGPVGWTCDVALLPEGATPEGFVRIPARLPSQPTPYWILEREVTSAEYLEFLNDPETRRAVDASPKPRLYPRNTGEGPKGHWPRAADGTFSFADDWAPDWPVLGISFDDARAYAEWRTRRARAEGRPWTFSLPNFGQWYAVTALEHRPFPFGNRFRQKWVKSCYSRRRAYPEPVLRFPRDESPYGVYDMCGSVGEWLDHWFDRDRGMRALAGGSWAYSKPDIFRSHSSVGWWPDRPGDEAGFRLVLVEDPKR
jgi:hypothetical protein